MRYHLLAAIAAMVVSGCTTVSQTVDDKTGIKTTVVAVRGCGNPSQTLTFVERPGKPEDSYASTGADLCNTAVSAGAHVASSAVLPGSAGVNNTVVSGSSSSANQSTNVSVN